MKPVRKYLYPVAVEFDNGLPNRNLTECTSALYKNSSTDWCFFVLIVCSTTIEMVFNCVRLLTCQFIIRFFIDFSFKISSQCIR